MLLAAVKSYYRGKDKKNKYTTMKKNKKLQFCYNCAIFSFRLWLPLLDTTGIVYHFRYLPIVTSATRATFYELLLDYTNGMTRYPTTRGFTVSKCTTMLNHRRVGVIKIRIMNF